MNILDENIPVNQRQLLRSWRIHVRQIGYDTGRQGMQDDEILSFLQQLHRPTFFTRDLGFYKQSLCHRRYGLVCMAVGKYEVASFIRRFLRHPEFDTEARRMGTVIRISRAGLAVWRLHAEVEQYLPWPD